MHPNTNLTLQKLKAAVESSRYLHNGFRISLFWIYIDQNQTDSALAIVNDFLKRYPDNRLARQMRGSVQFRSGHLNDARVTYEQLLPEYAAIKNASPNQPPIGYASCVGNLARIYTGLGMKIEAKARLMEWQQFRQSNLDPWLPMSLKQDLEHIKNH